MDTLKHLFEALTPERKLSVLHELKLTDSELKELFALENSQVDSYSKIKGEIIRTSKIQISDMSSIINELTNESYGS